MQDGRRHHEKGDVASRALPLPVRRTGLDLPRSHPHREIRDEVVGPLARAMADDNAVARCTSSSDGPQRFGDGPDLIQLDESGVGDLRLDDPLDDGGIGDKDVIAD